MLELIEGDSRQYKDDTTGKFDATKHKNKCSSLSVRRNFTKVPSTPEERKLPIQDVSKVKVINLKQIVNRANNQTASRLNYLMNLVRNPFGDNSDNKNPIVVARSKLCQKVDCEEFAKHGIYRKVSPEEEKATPSLGQLNVFSVVEIEKKRRRAIQHPLQQNQSIYENGYQPNLPDLQHVSRYLNSVSEPVGSVSDIHASFYTIPLDPGASKFYRFRDCDGNLYEMTKLLMGLNVSVEIQQIITSVIAVVCIQRRL
jgi:hypothetical protein